MNCLTPPANAAARRLAGRLKDALRKIVERLSRDLPLMPAGKRGEFNIQTISKSRGIVPN